LSCLAKILTQIVDYQLKLTWNIFPTLEPHLNHTCDQSCSINCV
jgi:hypothetical protein